MFVLYSGFLAARRLLLWGFALAVCSITLSAQTRIPIVNQDAMTADLSKLKLLRIEVPPLETEQVEIYGQTAIPPELPSAYRTVSISHQKPG